MMMLMLMLSHDARHAPQTLSPDLVPSATLYLSADQTPSGTAAPQGDLSGLCRGMTHSVLSDSPHSHSCCTWIQPSAPVHIRPMTNPRPPSPKP